MATQASLFSVPTAGQPEAAVLIEAQELPPVNGSGGGEPFSLQIQQTGVDLARKTVCIKVRLSRMGNTRQVSTSHIEADADKDLLRVSKHLVDSAELKAIGRFDGEIRRYLYNICLPFEIGIHLLPIAALEQVEQRLRQFAVDRTELVKAFLAAYPSLCVDAAKRLRGLYNPTDHPSGEDVAREFGFSWQYVSFGVPDQLKGISQEVWEQEREKAAQRMAEASSEIQHVLRETMAKLIQHMADPSRRGAMTSRSGSRSPLSLTWSNFLRTLSSATLPTTPNCKSWWRRLADCCRASALTICERPANCARRFSRAWPASPCNSTLCSCEPAVASSGSMRRNHDAGFRGRGPRRLRGNARCCSGAPGRR